MQLLVDVVFVAAGSDVCGVLVVVHERLSGVARRARFVGSVWGVCC